MIRSFFSRAAASPGARSRLTAAVGIALAVGASVLGAGPVSAASPAPTASKVAASAVTWAVVPAGADGPDGRVSLRHALAPGERVTDAVAVTNHSATPAEFTVAAGDGVVGADGAFDIAAGAPERGGAWLEIAGVEDGRLALAAGETRILPVTIAVPAEAAPGDQPAGIVVGHSAGSEGVAVTHRVGVRLHLQVTGEIEPLLRIDETTASFAPSWNPFVPGTLTVEYRVTNAGNVRLGASATADAAGPFGLLGAAARGDVRELLPGGSAMQTVEVPVTPLFLVAGEVSVASVALGDDRLALPGAVTAEFSAPAVPWSALVVVVFAAGAAVLVVTVVRRGRGRTRRRIDAAIAADRAARAGIR